MTAALPGVSIARFGCAPEQYRRFATAPKKSAATTPGVMVEVGQECGPSGGIEVSKAKCHLQYRQNQQGDAARRLWPQFDFDNAAADLQPVI